MVWQGWSSYSGRKLNAFSLILNHFWCLNFSLYTKTSKLKLSEIGDHKITFNQCSTSAQNNSPTQTQKFSRKIPRKTDLPPQNAHYNPWSSKLLLFPPPPHTKPPSFITPRLVTRERERVRASFRRKGPEKKQQAPQRHHAEIPRHSVCDFSLFID